MIPDYTNLQYAGSIGAVSVAAGYDLGKKDKTHLEVYYGYTPKYDSDNRMSSITVKGLRTLVHTVEISERHGLSWSPFTAGIGFSYIADKRFFSFNTELPYPEGYYWHKTGFRAMGFFQTELTHTLQSSRVKSISYYLEANMQDIYVTLKFADKHFTVLDMMRLGMGVKVRF
jgi:hypothetical protein